MTRRPLALVLAAGLVFLGGCAGDGGDETDGLDETDGATHVAVTISDEGCEPSEITTVEGKVAFDVSNDGSSKVTQFQVLDDDDTEVGSVEGVMSGEEETLTLELAQGDYITRCPNGATEEGKLSVRTGGPDGGPGENGGNPNDPPVGGEGGTESRLDDRRNGDGGPGGGGDGDSSPQGGG